MTLSNNKEENKKEENNKVKRTKKKKLCFFYSRGAISIYHLRHNSSPMSVVISK